MLYVSKLDKDNNSVYITDTEDGIVDVVTLHELQRIVKLGVVIDGTSYVDGELCVKVVKRVRNISTLILKLTTLRNYEECGHFRFNSKCNICWIFKNTLFERYGKNLDVYKTFSLTLAHNQGILFYVLPRVTRLGYLFSGCQVDSLDLSRFDTRNVTKMNDMFSSCVVKRHLDLSNFDTSNVTDMEAMFDGFKAESLDLSSFDTSNVTDMRYMFAGCRVESLDLSNFNTSKVTNMTGMFRRCCVKSLDISSFDTSNVTDMKDMFKGCQVECLDISGFDTRNVRYMRAMFSDCQISRIMVRDARIIERLENYGYSGRIIRV